MGAEVVLERLPSGGVPGEGGGEGMRGLVVPPLCCQVTWVALDMPVWCKWPQEAHGTRRITDHEFKPLIVPAEVAELKAQGLL